MKKTALYLFAFLFIAAFSGCVSSVKMALNEDQWRQKKEYAVTRQNPLFKQQTVAFGNYKTQEVKRSWTKGYSGRSGFSTDNFSLYVDQLSKKQTFRFKLQDGAQTAETWCATNLKGTDLVLGPASTGFRTVCDLLTIGLDSDSQFYAKILSDPKTAPWELFLDNQAAQRNKFYAGTLIQNPENYYSIVPVTRLQGKNGPISVPFGAVGFEFRNKFNEPVAAVSLIDKGVVYMQEVSEEEQFLLANACTALLLQQADL